MNYKLNHLPEILKPAAFKAVGLRERVCHYGRQVRAPTIKF